MAKAASSKARKRRSAKTPKISEEWRKLLSLVPGYDPFADAHDCWFDEALAHRVLDFFSECLTHVEGRLAGQPFSLEAWQQAVIANLFGWQKRDVRGEAVRRYREVVLYIPRKNGKTPLGAGICDYVLFCDGEPGAQIYGAAADKDQASLLYRIAKTMIEQEPELAQRAVVYKAMRSISLKSDPASVYKVLSADADTKHGGNSHLVLIDELHAQPNRDLVDVLLTSMASANRRQPLIVFITTADYARISICNEKYDYACKVRDGIIRDASFLPVIYEAKPDQDWTDPKVWAQANPNLGVSVSLEYLERECQRARETPAYENTFKRLHLNMRTEQDVRALAMEHWDKRCAGAVPDEAVAGQDCFLGLDLASTTDVAAAAMIFPPNEDREHLADKWLARWLFWIPAENARQRERRDRVPYETWARQGCIKMTAGDVIDYDVIRADLNALRERCNIREIAADRWNATQILTQLAGDGFEIVAFGQGFKDMTAPTKELLKLVVAGDLRHGDNPVARWMASNLAVETDAAANLKPSKKKSTEKIDGMVAAIMGLGRAMVAVGGDGPTVTWV